LLLFAVLPLLLPDDPQALQQLIDISCPPGAQQQTHSSSSMRMMVQTDRPLHRLCSTHYVGTVHTHTHPFSGPLSGTTRVNQYQKGKTNLHFTEARDSEWQWHQLGHMQVCTALQADNHANTPPLCFFTGRVPFLPPNQRRQSTEGKSTEHTVQCHYNSV